MERFSLGISEKDAANGLYASVKAEVEYYGGSFVLDEDTRDHILEAARWLIDPNSTRGLLLCGMYGNGKTTLANAISRLIGVVTEHENGYSKREYMPIYKAKDICRMCAASEKFKEQYDRYNSLFKEPMMIIDDFGEEPTEVMVYGMVHTPLIDIINERYASRLMTIITTNLDAEQLRAKYGARTYDRLREMLTSITFKNESYRGHKTCNQVVDQG